MKADELMTGDWVLDGDNVAQVTGITCDGIIETTVNETSNIEVIFPIPITPEILEKNEFKNNGKDKDMLYWNWSICEDCVSYDKETGIIRIFHCLGSLIFVHPLSYVHELQHALRLCNIDKEIVL